MPEDLFDYAEAPPDFVLARDLPDESGFVIERYTILDSDEIEGSYPEYGSFLPCSRAGSDGRSEVFVECPRSLAALIVEHDLDAGDEFEVADATKDDQERWTFELNR
jgi:hypothetical protein